MDLRVTFYILTIFYLVSSMEKQLVRQHNAITQARYEMSALEKNIMYMLLSLLKEEDTPGRIYKIRLQDLKRLTGRDIDHEHFSKTTKKLVNRLLYTQYGNEQELAFNLLASGRYKGEIGSIELEVSREMRTFLFALKNKFTLFSLRIALSLKSKYAKRLYEMICQYKDTGLWSISIDELKARLFLIEQKTGKEKYPKFGLFRAKVLDVAQQEIAQKAEFTFTYEAKKTQRKYTHLLFKIRKQEQPIEIQQDPAQQTTHTAVANQPPLKRLIEKYKLSPWQAQKIIKELPVKEIHKTTYDIQVEVMSNRVRNVGAYTAKVFDKKYNLGLFKNP